MLAVPVKKKKNLKGIENTVAKSGRLDVLTTMRATQTKAENAISVLLWLCGTCCVNRVYTRVLAANRHKCSIIDQSEQFNLLKILV